MRPALFDCFRQRVDFGALLLYAIGMKLLNDINQSIEIENKSSHADRLFNGLSLTGSLLACALLLGALITYAVDVQSGLIAFACVFYPLVVFEIVAFVFGIQELVRNRYFTSILSVSLASIVLLGTVAFLILQGVYFGGVAVFPCFHM